MSSVESSASVAKPSLLPALPPALVIKKIEESATENVSLSPPPPERMLDVFA